MFLQNSAISMAAGSIAKKSNRFFHFNAKIWEFSPFAAEAVTLPLVRLIVSDETQQHTADVFDEVIESESAFG